MNFPSRLVEDAVKEISKLPGIGKKSALRLVLHLLRQEVQQSVQLADALLKLRTEICYCRKCHSISDAELCSFCENIHRDHSQICVVCEMPDLLAIENTGYFRGVYHLLGGVISPVEGVGAENLNISSLIDRVKSGEITEVILAIPSTMEGETTAYYISKKLKNFGVLVSSIARGVPLGSDLEYTDELTLGRSIARRISFDSESNI